MFYNHVKLHHSPILVQLMQQKNRQIEEANNKTSGNSEKGMAYIHLNQANSFNELDEVSKRSLKEGDNLSSNQALNIKDVILSARMQAFQQQIALKQQQAAVMNSSADNMRLIQQHLLNNAQASQSFVGQQAIIQSSTPSVLNAQAAAKGNDVDSSFHSSEITHSNPYLFWQQYQQSFRKIQQANISSSNNQKQDPCSTDNQITKDSFDETHKAELVSHPNGRSSLNKWNNFTFQKNNDLNVAKALDLKVETNSSTSAHQLDFSNQDVNV